MPTLDRRFTHRGRSVSWARLGEGPPLVLIHGFPWSSQSWRRIAPHLAARRTVYLFDMIGAGESDKAPGQDVSPAVQNALLAALFEHWALERPEVAAHDFGGLAALRGYFVNGLRYARLTLFDAVAVLPSGSPFFAHVREHEAAFAGLPAYAHEALFRAYIQRAAHRPLSAEVVQIYAAPWRGERGQPGFYAQIAQSGDRYIEDIVGRYGPMDCPVDLVWGAEDGFIPPAQGDELAARLGVEPPKRIAGAGHLVQEDAPEAVVAALLGAAQI